MAVSHVPNREKMTLARPVMSIAVASHEEKAADTEDSLKVRLAEGAFLCFCGLSFPDREPFDTHFRSAHSGRFTTCSDCGRVLPKGQWRLDREGTFYFEGDRRGFEATRP